MNTAQFCKSLQTLGLIILGLAAFSSCSEVNSLEGMYQGTMQKGSATSLVTGNLTVKNLDDSPENFEVTFKMYESSAVNPPIESKIQFVSDTEAKMTSPLFGKAAKVNLKRHDRCAINKDKSVSLCLDNGSLKLKIDQNFLGHNMVIQLQKMDSSNFYLSPIPIENREYGIDEVLGLAKFKNYLVQAEAEKVIQARNNVNVAKGNLLPKLNWRGPAIVIGADYTGGFQTFFPFLFPKNWFHLQQSKFASSADKYAFISLRANEINTVESIYYEILRDEEIAAELRKQLTWTKQILEAIKLKEEVGEVTKNSIMPIKLLASNLQFDVVQIESSIKKQKSTLAQALGMAPLQEFKALKNIVMPDFSKVVEIQADINFAGVIEKSFEIKGVNALLKIAQSSKEQLNFSFLSPDEADGIGFNSFAKINIEQSQINVLKIKKEEIKSTLALKMAQAVSDYNQALQAVSTSTENVQTLTEQLNYIVANSIQAGGSTPLESLMELVDVQQKILSSKSELINSRYLWLTAKSRIDRLQLKGFYSRLDDALP